MDNLNYQEIFKWSWKDFNSELAALETLNR